MYIYVHLLTHMHMCIYVLLLTHTHVHAHTHAHILSFFRSLTHNILTSTGFALFHLLMDPVCREHILSPDIAVEYVGLLRAPDAQVCMCWRVQVCDREHVPSPDIVVEYVGVLRASDAQIYVC